MPDMHYRITRLTPDSYKLDRAIRSSHVYSSVQGIHGLRMFVKMLRQLGYKRMVN